VLEYLFKHTILFVYFTGQKEFYKQHAECSNGNKYYTSYNYGIS